jgi:hypothetical protein
MKKIKILVLLVTLSVVTFYSCTDNNPIENEVVTQKSIAARTTMNELKIANNISDKNGNSTTSNPFCFEFVYPITLSYNTGTTVTVTSLQGLLTILAGENSSLYIDGISFPFQVMYGGAIQTISTEGQFISLLTSCGFNTINNDLINSFCFDIVFPITLINPNNQIVAIGSQAEFISYLSDPTVAQSQIAYPISVIYQNQTVVIDNVYEMYQMINNCNDCICTLQYDPVCVQTPTGIVEFGNFCFAQCAGFTQNDLVSCDPSSACSITNLTTAVTGNCNSDFSYPLTINFSYVNAPSTHFTVRKSSGVILGTYPLSNLPITIPNYVSNTNATDFLTVQLGNSCSEMQNWILPNCSNCGCPTGGNPVCVQTATGVVQYANDCLALCAGHQQSSFVTCPTTSNFSTQLGTCFSISYPVQVQFQGALVTVTSNSQLLQYYFPVQGPIPAFVYPITVTFGNQTVIVTSQAGFQSLISGNCN